MKSAACLLFILFAKSFAFAQELKFNEKGIAEITIPVTAGTSVDLYDDVLTFISKYYMMTNILENDVARKQLPYRLFTTTPLIEKYSQPDVRYCIKSII